MIYFSGQIRLIHDFLHPFGPEKIRVMFICSLNLGPKVIRNVAGLKKSTKKLPIG